MTYLVGEHCPACTPMANRAEASRRDHGARGRPCCGARPVPPYVADRTVADEVREVPIRVGQFLKLANLVESGSEAKPLLAAGMVRVNDEVETRRGRQLQSGDVVSIAAQSARVATGEVKDDLPW